MHRSRIIIELAGGLGNQMFQYAFYLKMKHLGYACDLYVDQSQHIHNGPELEQAFGIHLTFADRKNIEDLLDKNHDIFSKIKRKLTGSSPSFYWEHDKGYDYKPEIFDQKKPIYLQGCWLSEKYFKDIEEKVRTAFRFPEINDENKQLYNLITANENSVSIHIRKGDYAKSPIHLNIDYKTYLQKAANYIRQFVKQPYWFVFSDDIDFAKDVFQQNKLFEDNVQFVDWNIGQQSYRDMQLMAACRHNIITNSTFSWWGAWLNTNQEKMVISPANWFSKDSLNKNSIIPASWIRI